MKRMNECINSKFTLVSAPAGFGKTTLVCEWLNGFDIPHAWISLDEMDNDIERFLSYFIAALKLINPVIGRYTDEVHRSSHLGETESLITRLVNDISSMDSSFMLVFDDYHFIQSQPVHNAVGFLIEHIPPQMHLLISSRSDPPINRSRLRASGYMCEIRGSDLRFTETEITQFFKQSINIELSTDEVQTLEERTEGWITGLQLAALSMRSLEDDDRIIQSVASQQLVSEPVELVLGEAPAIGLRCLQLAVSFGGGIAAVLDQDLGERLADRLHRGARQSTVDFSGPILGAETDVGILPRLPC